MATDALFIRMTYRVRQEMHKVVRPWLYQHLTDGAPKQLLTGDQLCADFHLLHSTTSPVPTFFHSPPGIVCGGQ